MLARDYEAPARPGRVRDRDGRDGIAWVGAERGDGSGIAYHGSCLCTFVPIQQQYFLSFSVRNAMLIVYFPSEEHGRQRLVRTAPPIDSQVRDDAISRHRCCSDPESVHHCP